MNRRCESAIERVRRHVPNQWENFGTYLVVVAFVDPCTCLIC